MNEEVGCRVLNTQLLFIAGFSTDCSELQDTGPIYRTTSPDELLPLRQQGNGGTRILLLGWRGISTSRHGQMTIRRCLGVDV